PGGLSPAQRHTRRLWAAFAMSGIALASGVLVAASRTLPYFSFSPGNAIETEALVEVEEGQPTFQSEGEILFLTARIGRVTPLEAFAGWVAGDVDIFEEAGVLGGLRDEENRLRQAEAMTASKNTALIVALDELGLPYDPTGTGAVVQEPPTAGSPADGLVQVADTIVSIDGQPIGLSSELGEAIGSRPPGTEVTIGVEDLDGEVREVVATLAARPDDPNRGFLGVATETRDFEPRAAFAVDINQGQVGGPSAGLAFTLAIIDVLTEGDLTGGLRIAVTGSIGPDGTVFAVGGVAQKTVAAAAAGADVLLLPAGEEAEAMRSPRGLEIIGVEDIDDALAVLADLGGDP
ncbi:MAG TPA: S16 family serine protease, partial [Acidimicrobiales bacterium]|nr:S16 family serine protease [Acidimicrobiales bacterium]